MIANDIIIAIKVSGPVEEFISQQSSPYQKEILPAYALTFCKFKRILVFF